MSGKVALVSGGGSGHEPLHGGFVGRGMLDAACPGEVFTSPVPEQMLAATKAVDGGAGVVHIVKNYTGDVMNFKLAAEDAADEGIGVESVLVDDDVAVQDSLYTAGRRGVGATVLAEKIAGAAAERGDDLAGGRGDRAARQRALALVRRGAVVVHAAGGRASRSSTCPTGEVEVGIGIHGEPGRRREPLGTAREIAHDDGRGGAQRPAPAAGARVLPFVNGMGGTPQLELYLLYGEIEQRLRGGRARAGALARRLLHHVAGDGGRVADAARARRRAHRAVGCSRPHRRPALGSVTDGGHRRPSVDATHRHRLADRGRGARSAPSATT